MKRDCLTFIFWCACTAMASSSIADVLFESGTLGPTGIPFADLGGTVPGTNVNEFVFPGVRFYLARPAITFQVGGHFVASTGGTFFGAIVALDGGNDFPDSATLSTPDVLGAATLTFPDPSLEVLGDLSLSLDPGWYALVFGSGLFGTNGTGGAVRNGEDIDDPAYIGYGPNLHWFNLDIFQNPFDNHRFVITGTFVPEPNTLCIACPLFVCLFCIRRR